MARIIKCARCGKETEATGPRSKYCPSCKEEIRAGGKIEIVNGARVKHIKCAICGKDTVVSIKAAHEKFCKDCSGQAYKETRAAWKRRVRVQSGEAQNGEKITSFCTVCGKEFSYIYNGYYLARCEKCRGKGGRAAQPIRRYEKRPGNTRLDAAQRAAQELGMSYGKYKAMLAMQKMKKAKQKKKTRKKGA